MKFCGHCTSTFISSVVPASSVIHRLGLDETRFGGHMNLEFYQMNTLMILLRQFLFFIQIFLTSYILQKHCGNMKCYYQVGCIYVYIQSKHACKLPSLMRNVQFDDLLKARKSNLGEYARCEGFRRQCVPLLVVSKQEFLSSSVDVWMVHSIYLK